MAAHERVRAEGVATEAGDDIGQPVRRVGMAGAVLGVAVQRQIGKDEAKPVSCSTIGSHSRCESPAECSSPSGGPDPASRYATRAPSGWW